MLNKTLCVKCGLNVCNPCFSGAANDNYGVVQLIPDELLRSPDTINEMARKCAALNISSRQFPLAVAHEILMFQGVMLTHFGTPLQIGPHFVHNSFLPEDHREQDEDNDLELGNGGEVFVPDYRWVRGFFNKSKRPARQFAQWKVLGRLQSIWLYLGILELKAKREAK